MSRRALTLLLGLAAAAPACRAADDYGVAFAGAQPAPARAPDGLGPITVVGVILLGGAGAWLLVRGRKIQLPGRVVRRLNIDETRSLGSRQYLVVASYEGKKLLLGVCPGRIDLLTPLDASPSPAKPQ